MSVPLALLGLLEREPSYGYDLKRDYDAYFGRGKPLQFGQVYATLARLTRDGKVAPGEMEVEGDRIESSMPSRTAGSTNSRRG